MSTEQWEIRKNFLVRSLFDESSLLSPITEPQEKSVESIMPNGTPYTKASIPLSDLVIEKEPNRHDEPEEFYQALEKKVMRLYRKLFTDAEESSQLSEQFHSEESNVDQTIDQDSCDFENCDKHAAIPSKKTLTKNKQSPYKERLNEIREKTKSIDPVIRASTSSESQKHEIIITQALVHYPGNVEIDDYNYVIVGGTQGASAKNQDERNVDSVAVASSVIYVEDNNEQSGRCFSNNEQHEDTNLSGDERRISNICQPDTNSSPEEPEMMRRLEISNDSAGSINSLDIRKYFSKENIDDKTYDFNFLREWDDVEASSPELSIILGTTCESKIVANERACNRQERNKKRGVPLETESYRNNSPLKRRKFENLATQTSFSSSESESNWHHIQNNFFEGNPCIFKLCSCINHVCS